MDISLKLTKKKLDAGAIKFERDEFSFILDAKGVPLKIVKKKHLKTHKLIEEYMLLANKHVAKFIHDKCKENNGGNDCPLMYRVHNVPLAEKMNHHPDLFIHSYKKLKITLFTHSENKITDKDYDLAKKIDEIK